MPSLRQHHDDIDEPLALHGRDGDAGSEGLDADAEAEAEAAAAAAAEAADFVSAEEWEAMRVATLAVQAPLPAPAEPQALTVQRPRRPGPPRKVTAKTLRRPRPPGSNPGAGTTRAPRLPPGSAAAAAVPTRSSATP